MISVIYAHHRTRHTVTKQRGLCSRFVPLALLAVLMLMLNFATPSAAEHQSFEGRRLNNATVSSKLTTSSSPAPTLTASPSTSSPSAAPSGSTAPTVLPTLSPTVTPAPTRTYSPSLRPSVSPRPSVTPTNEPTETPVPSPSPSDLPSLSPTRTRQPSPSPSTSLIPSASPSDVPSESPSVHPTNYPTTSPSSFPSSTPTLECHDVAPYRSPINGFRCRDHVGTDCTMWRHLGLNATELEELVESCPVSCRIDCGAFSTVDTSLTFVLSNLPGLLDFETQVPLETTIKSFMTSFVQSKEAGSTLELTDVVLKSQALLGKRRLSGRLLSASTNEVLRVKVNLLGFSINLAQNRLMEDLEEALDADGFTTALQNSYPFFRDAVASSVDGYQPIDNVSKTPSTGSKPSAAVVTVSVLISVMVVGFAATGAYIYRKNGGNLGHLMPFLHEKEVHPAIGSPDVESNLERPYEITRSPTSSNNTARTEQQANTYASRLLRNFSRSPRSDSQGTRSDDTHPTSSDEGLVPKEAPKRIHPLARVVPPMIVIDNIEGEYEESLYTSRDDENGVVPIKHMQAGRGFADALNTSYASETPSGITDMLYNYSSFGDGRGGGLLSPKERALTEIFSDDIFDDEVSVSSTPIKGTDMNIDVPVRRTLSDGSVEDMAVAEVLEELMGSDWEDLDTSVSLVDTSMISNNSYMRPTTPKGRKHKTWGKTTIEGIMTPMRKTFAEAKRARRHTDRANRHSFDFTAGNIASSPANRLSTSLSPIRQNSASPSRAVGPVMPVLNVDVPPMHPNRSRRNSAGSHERIPSDEIQYTFNAPTNARLGLTIEYSRSLGPFIHTVKDYSPLLGSIEVGDKIVMVDGINTHRMEKGDLMKLLGRKRGTIDTIQITVSRVLTKPNIQTLPMKKGHKTDGSSVGSASHASGRMGQVAGASW